MRRFLFVAIALPVISGCTAVHVHQPLEVISDTGGESANVACHRLYDKTAIDPCAVLTKPED